MAFSRQNRYHKLNLKALSGFAFAFRWYSGDIAKLINRAGCGDDSTITSQDLIWKVMTFFLSPKCHRFHMLTEVIKLFPCFLSNLPVFFILVKSWLISVECFDVKSFRVDINKKFTFSLNFKCTKTISFVQSLNFFRFKTPTFRKISLLFSCFSL